ncbi:MAG TPA: TIGR03435 family protein [Candidatus Acidoferrales bacterium]|nr:TIGR03435 family protein [Candidatus Acidoferrales bacterium]
MCGVRPRRGQPTGVRRGFHQAQSASRGKDANNQIFIGPAGLSGRNVTLKRLIVQAYHLQPHQVFGGPNWLDNTEYDIDAKADGPTGSAQLELMLRTLLTDRFQLSVHTEAKELRLYELVTDRNGPKIHALKDTEAPAAKTAKTGAAGLRNFRGDLQQFANLLSVQLSIPLMDDPGKPSVASGPPVPVVDKTGLPGIFDISVDMKLELGVDMFVLWQRVLQEQLGLKLESRKAKVEVLVVDRAERIPTAN